MVDIVDGLDAAVVELVSPFVLCVSTSSPLDPSEFVLWASSSPPLGVTVQGGKKVTISSSKPGSSVMRVVVDWLVVGVVVVVVVVVDEEEEEESKASTTVPPRLHEKVHSKVFPHNRNVAFSVHLLSRNVPLSANTVIVIT